MDLSVLLDLVEGVGGVLNDLNKHKQNSTTKVESFYIDDVGSGLSNSIIVLLPHNQTTALQTAELGVGSVEGIGKVVDKRLNSLVRVLVVVDESGYIC